MKLYQNILQDKHQRLVLILFDTINHGNRLIDKSRNDTWEEGNPWHDVDMHALLSCNVSDMSLLMDYIPIYFPQFHISKWGVLGVSLGGHSALLATARGKAFASVFHKLFFKKKFNRT